MRALFPRFLIMAREKVSSHAEFALGCVFENGRVTLQHLVGELIRQDDQVRQSSSDEADGALDKDMPLEAKKKVFEQAFQQLVLARYIERVPTEWATAKGSNVEGTVNTLATSSASTGSATLAVTGPNFDDDPSAFSARELISESSDSRRSFRGRGRGRGRGGPVASRGRGRGKKVEAREVKDADDGEFRVGNCQSNPDRFLLPNRFIDVDGTTSDEGKQKKRKREGGSGDGKPEKKHKVGDGKAVSVAEDEKGVMWRVNWEQFMKELRHAAILEYVQQRYGPECQAIVRELLRLSCPYETKLNCQESKSVTYEELMVALKDEDNKSFQNESILTGYLKPLQESDEIRIASREVASARGGNTFMNIFSLNMEKLISTIRLKKAESYIQDRFSANGLRLWRLLRDKKFLEEKQIADLAMLPKKDAWELLHRLHAADYARLQEIPRTSDRQVQRSIFLWTVDDARVLSRVTKTVSVSFRNCWLRAVNERDRMEKFQVPVHLAIFLFVSEWFAQAVGDMDTWTDEQVEEWDAMQVTLRSFCADFLFD
mmetsp:Transcript_39445/g.101137  ORF Transcript_39445/g.101137 Transcript_39445/m.101137 type:complete len:544 (-) Transcript_39445:1562-3193(-)